MTMQTCTNCGVRTDEFGLTDDAGPFCYECGANMQRDTMIRTGSAILYLSIAPQPSRPYQRTGFVGPCKVGDWTGNLEFSAGNATIGRHNMAGRRYDFDFIGPNGAQWHGIQYGDNTQIAHCKRSKGE